MESHRFDENVENHVLRVIDAEFQASKTGRDASINDFDAQIDILEGNRTEKDYDWMSDTNYPQYISIFNTDMSLFANQYFQSRDFVDVYLESEAQKKECEAAKKCINRTLNRRDLYYYPKYMRARAINFLAGQVYAVCWWEQEANNPPATPPPAPEVGMGMDGAASGQEQLEMAPAGPVETQEAPSIRLDQFNFDIYDHRNVFTDSKYCYSVQEKEWIILRSEQSYGQLVSKRSLNGYFNLDLVKGMMKQPMETDTAKETYNKGNENQVNAVDKSPVVLVDVLERFGKVWAVNVYRNAYGHIAAIEPGYDVAGDILPGAELVEAIVTYAVRGSQKILIRFQPTPFIDKRGRTYKPVVRGLCYPHPTKDDGLSSGKHLRESQIAFNDTLNMSNDRVKLATIPVMKGRKYVMEQMGDFVFEPGYVNPVEDPMTDITELKISADVGAALQQAMFIKSNMEQVESTPMSSQGMLSGNSSTTATEIAGAESRTNIRNTYKSLTFEYTFLNEFYWMILQMTWRFANEQTIIAMLGDAAADLDPEQDFTYKPISSSVEAEYSKKTKLQTLMQMLNVVAKIPNPATIKAINVMLAEMFKLLGAETMELSKIFLDASVPPPAPGGAAGGQGVPQMGNQPPMMGPAASNQNGLPMSGQEEALRANTDQLPQGGM